MTCIERRSQPSLAIPAQETCDMRMRMPFGPSQSHKCHVQKIQSSRHMAPVKMPSSPQPFDPRHHKIGMNYPCCVLSEFQTHRIVNIINISYFLPVKKYYHDGRHIVILNSFILFKCWLFFWKKSIFLILHLLFSYLFISKYTHRIVFYNI